MNKTSTNSAISSIDYSDAEITEIDLFRNEYAPALKAMQKLLPKNQLRFINKGLPDLGASVEELLHEAYSLISRPTGKFLAITALEEASTALGSSLVHKGYVSPEYFSARSHVSKEKIALTGSICAEFVGDLFRDTAGAFSNPKIKVGSGGARLKFAIGSDWVLETRMTEIQVTTEDYTFDKLAERKFAELLGPEKNLTNLLKKRANIRNLCLYSGQSGLPKDRFQNPTELRNIALQCIYTLMMAIDVMESVEVPMLLGACIKGIQASDCL